LPPERRLAEALARLDRLTAAGVITGYTLEALPRYLEEGARAVTYAAYEGHSVEHRHLAAAVGALTAAGGEVTVHRRRGTVRCGRGVGRSRELMAVARFASAGALEAGLEEVADPSFCGRWRYPDIRVTGGQGRGLVEAYAHSILSGRWAAVVLSLLTSPPVPGMTSRRVRLLPAWIDYLGGSDASGPAGWSAGIGRELPGTP
jgi:DNA-binding Lrp family transcriptional regulator